MNAKLEMYHDGKQWVLILYTNKIGSQVVEIKLTDEKAHELENAGINKV